jgi:hypothetical protein
MRNDIEVCVFRPAKRKHFHVQGTDRVTGENKTRSTSKIKRCDAERVAAIIERETREGKYKLPSQVTWVVPRKQVRRRFFDLSHGHLFLRPKVSRTYEMPCEQEC